MNETETWSLPAINLAQLYSTLSRLRMLGRTPLTLSTESLERIKASLGIDREAVLVLSSSCDRPNVYQQSRRLHRRVDVWYIEYDFRKRDLHFILAGTSTRT